MKPAAFIVIATIFVFADTAAGAQHFKKQQQAQERVGKRLHRYKTNSEAF